MVLRRYYSLNDFNKTFPVKTVWFHERDVIDGKLVNVGDTIVLFEANDEFDSLMFVYVHSVDYAPNHIIAHVMHQNPVKDLKIRVEDYRVRVGYEDWYQYGVMFVLVEEVT